MIRRIAPLLPLVLAACGPATDEQEAERLDKPYADRIKQVEQQQIQQAQDQLKAIDEQTSGKSSGDDG